MDATPIDADLPVADARQKRQALIAMHQRRARRLWGIAAVLFALTCVSMWAVNGPVYAAAAISILLAHEMGHFLQAVRYRVPASPPMFIPMPFLSPFGTMGAVIAQAGGVANRKALFDIAISGPLAGLVLALPITWIGLQEAKILTPDPTAQSLIFGDPLILQWMIALTHRPLVAGEEIGLTPLLFAGWLGIFITALNLIPIGQLDGGHILYTLIGRRAHRVAMLLIATAVGFMIYTQDLGYLVMLLLIWKMGPKHPPTADDSVPLGPVRITLGWLTLAFIIVGFTPRPMFVAEPTAAPDVGPQTSEVRSPADEVADRKSGE